MRLREWLIAQIDSGKYAGLSWVNEEKTLFKIPWKHAAKQDYRQNEDAALFKVPVLITVSGILLICVFMQISLNDHTETRDAKYTH